MSCSSSIFYVFQPTLTSPPSESSRRTWRWRPSGPRLSRTCPIWWRCKRRDCRPLLRELPVYSRWRRLPPLRLFQNHRNVKTPDSHPPGCLQQHREPAILVSRRPGRKNRERKMKAHLCFYLCFPARPKWVRVTGLAQTDLPWERRCYLFMSTQTLVLKRHPDCHWSKLFMGHSVQSFDILQVAKFSANSQSSGSLNTISLPLFHWKRSNIWFFFLVIIASTIQDMGLRTNLAF